MHVEEGQSDLGQAMAQGKNVPDFPLAKKWHELVMKALIRHAAEGNYDKLTWTTGEQQAERYDLSKRVDIVHLKPTPDGKYALNAMKDNQRVLGATLTSLDKLQDYVGKETADKLKDRLDKAEDKNEGVGVSGGDLKVEGAGKKEIYNKMFVQDAKDIAKKFDSKVEDTKIKTTPESGGTATVHGIDITPSMKQTVLEKGQSLFELGSAAALYGGTQYGIDQLPISDDNKKKLHYAVSSLALAGVAGVFGAAFSPAAKDFVSKVRSAALEKVFSSSIHVDDIGAELDRQFEDMKKSGDWMQLSDAEKKAVTEAHVNRRTQEALKDFQTAGKENIPPRQSPTGVSNIVLPSGAKTTEEQNQASVALAATPKNVDAGTFRGWLNRFGWSKSDADAILNSKGYYGQPFLYEIPPKGEAPKQGARLAWIDPTQPIGEIQNLSLIGNHLRTTESALVNAMGRTGERLPDVIEWFKKQLSPSVVFRGIFQGSANTPAVDGMEAVQSANVNREVYGRYATESLKGVSSVRKQVNKALKPLWNEYRPLYEQLMKISDIETKDGEQHIMYKPGKEAEGEALWTQMEDVLKRRDASTLELQNSIHRSGYS